MRQRRALVQRRCARGAARSCVLCCAGAAPPPTPPRPAPAAGLASSSGRGQLDSHPMYPCAKLKLDQLFLQWLSLPDSQALVRLPGGPPGSAPRE
jgi:hypothetical protein